MNPSGENKLENQAADRPSERPAGPGGRGAVVGVCVLLAVTVLLVFGRTLRYEFVNFDDDLYVYQNPEVVKGLTYQGTVQVFTHRMCDFYHPLTMLSLMLDAQIYGLNAGGYHLTNVLLHAATTVLLFLVLRRMMGLRPDAFIGAAVTRADTLWPSAFVAALFAIHPLRVESVAWVTERKDMLSGLFFMLTLGAYVRYVEKSKIHPSSAVLLRRTGGSKSRVWYGLMLLSYTLGLLSKPSLVTLPFVLLLLDYWPLDRMAPLVRGSTFKVLRPLIMEKLPLFVLSAAVCMATVFAQQKELPSGELSLSLRLGNAAVSYIAYLGQMFHPVGLAILYPYPEKGLPQWEIVVALVLLTGITAGVLALRSKQPYLLMGWLWYLGILVPNIGVVQAGIVARADRFTYLSQIGLYLAIAWAVRDFTVSWRYRRQVLVAGAITVIAALMVFASIQTSYWRDSESLWTHALACTSGNYVGLNNLGLVFAKRGQSLEAMKYYQKSLEINPGYIDAHNNLGIILAEQGHDAEAMEHLQRALEIRPDYAAAHYNLGNLLDGQGRSNEAIEHYQRAIASKPDFAEAHYNLGGVLVRQGRNLEAINQYQQVIEIKPDFAGVHYNLGVVLAAQGFNAEAIPHFQKALENKPDNAGAHNNLGVLLAQQGQSAEAIRHLKKAIELQPDGADAYSSLGNVLSDQGQLAEAITNYQKAIELNPDFAAAHYNLGNALALQGRYAEAIGHFQKALQLRPDDAKARQSLDAALGLLNQSEKGTGKPANP